MEDSIVGFKKAVDEFMNKLHAVDYFHLEGDFNFPSTVRYQFGNFTFTTGRSKVGNLAKLIGIEETHSFHVYGQANIPHLEGIEISASFNENGVPAENREKPTILGTGILERGFKFAISVPPNIAKNSLELIWSGQRRTTPSGAPEKPHIRIRFDLYNIKTDHKGRPIFDVGRIYIYEDG